MLFIHNQYTCLYNWKRCNWKNWIWIVSSVMWHLFLVINYFSFLRGLVANRKAFNLWLRDWIAWHLEVVPMDRMNLLFLQQSAESLMLCGTRPEPNALMDWKLIWGKLDVTCSFVLPILQRSIFQYWNTRFKSLNQAAVSLTICHACMLLKKYS